MSVRILIHFTMLGSVMLISVSAAIDWSPVLIWNASASVSIGLYYVQPEDHLAVTDLVVVMPPEPVASFLAERNYLPRGVPLLKHVLALPGQTVCRNRLAIMIDGVVMSFARERDRRGRPLPVWQGCKLIAEGDLEKVISLGGSRPRIELTYRGQLPDGRFGSLAGVREVGTTVSEGKAILEMNSFAQIAEVLGENDVSVRSVVQRGRADDATLWLKELGDKVTVRLVEAARTGDLGAASRLLQRLHPHQDNPVATQLGMSAW